MLFVSVFERNIMELIEGSADGKGRSCVSNMDSVCCCVFRLTVVKVCVTFQVLQHEEIGTIAFTGVCQQVIWKTRTEFSDQIDLFTSRAYYMPILYTGHTLRSFLLKMRSSHIIYFIFHAPASVHQHAILALWERNESWITCLTWFQFFKCPYVLLPSTYCVCFNTLMLAHMEKQLGYPLLPIKTPTTNSTPLLIHTLQRPPSISRAVMYYSCYFMQHICKCIKTE